MVPLIQTLGHLHWLERELHSILEEFPLSLGLYAVASYVNAPADALGRT